MFVLLQMYTLTFICYILFFKIKDSISLFLLQVAPGVVLGHQPMGVTCIIFKFVKCLTGANKALYITDNHILYYHV